jgi:hypothetical protein
MTQVWKANAPPTRLPTVINEAAHHVNLAKRKHVPFRPPLALRLTSKPFRVNLAAFPNAGLTLLRTTRVAAEKTDVKNYSGLLLLVLDVKIARVFGD